MYFLFILCLLPLISTSTPVIGGRDAGEVREFNNEHVVFNPGKYPYMVYIEFCEIFFQNATVINGRKSRCGGVLIREDVVLTASHCFLDPLGIPSVTVKAGMVHLKLEKDTQQSFAKDFDIYNKYENYRMSSDPEYWSGEHTNDIALLWLEMKFILNAKVKLAKLAVDGTHWDGFRAVVLGWGKTSYASETEMLQEGEVKVISKYNCQKAHYPITVTDSMLCTLPVRKDVTPCDGDSGGPLIINKEVVGIISWAEELMLQDVDGKSYSSCNSKLPAVYTRVSTFRSWIDDSISRGPPQERKLQKKSSTSRDDENKTKIKGSKSSLKACEERPKGCVIT